MLSAHPLAALVAFAAPPEEVLGALLAGRPMPAVGPREHWLLFAPCFPRGARGASAAEARLFEAIRSGRWIVQADPDTSAALAELWAAGAVVRSDTGH
jgi:hypothetical protein